MYQRSCKNGLLDDKNKLLDEVAGYNNKVTRATEDNIN